MRGALQPQDRQAARFFQRANKLFLVQWPEQRILRAGVSQTIIELCRRGQAATRTPQGDTLGCKAAQAEPGGRAGSYWVGPGHKRTKSQTGNAPPPPPPPPPRGGPPPRAAKKLYTF